MPVWRPCAACHQAAASSGPLLRALDASDRCALGLMRRSRRRLRVCAVAPSPQMERRHDKAYEVYDQLLEGSNFAFAPWILVNGEDRRTANVQVAEALVGAIEHALAIGPNAAEEEAKKKAAENSARSANAAEGGAEGGTSNDAEAIRAAAEAEAAAQHALAPRGSGSIIMAGYPRIDHSRPKPVFEPKEDYKAALKAEQRKLRELEMEMYQKRIPLMLMYEGWDAAGKGGNIRRVTYALDPRGFDVHPIASPSPDEKNRHYLWRFWTKLPKTGHICIFDRTWYGRVMVERLEGFCTEKEWRRAYHEINEFERMLTDSGTVLLKFWLHIDQDVQLERFTNRENTPEKQWKITDEDWRNRDKWPEYEAAVDELLQKTSTKNAPWYIIESNDKKYARIKTLRIIVKAIEKACEKHFKNLME